MEKVGRGRPKGYKCSEETKAKISDARRGKKLSEEVKQKIADAMKKKFRQMAGAPIELLTRTDLKKCPEKPRSDGFIDIVIQDPAGPKYIMLKHTAVMEKHIGRKLKKTERIFQWGGRSNCLIDYMTLCKNKAEAQKLENILRKLVRR